MVGCAGCAGCGLGYTQEMAEREGVVIVVVREEAGRVEADARPVACVGGWEGSPPEQAAGWGRLLGGWALPPWRMG